MAAQPKNKITRVEQGKRRHGNTPKLLKDTTTSRVPLHKQALFGKLLKMVAPNMGGTTKKETKEEKKESHGAAKTSQAPALAPVPNRAVPTKAASTIKKVVRTQHKGG